MKLGVVLVDHGSRREESNLQFVEIVEKFAEWAELDIVEPAHLEIARPTIKEAFVRCIERGATRVIVVPYFLLPGRHSRIDIKQQVEEVAKRYPEVEWDVSEPLGMSEKIFDVLLERLHSTESSQ